MRRTSRFLAVTAGLALAMSPAIAFANPDEPHLAPSTPASPPPAVIDALLSEQPRTNPAEPGEVPTPTPTTEKVMVMLTGQPTGPGNELIRLAEVQELAQQWSETYQFKVDRSFGYLIKGFSAEIPIDQIAKLQAEPQVKSVQPVRTYYPVMETAADLTQSVTARSINGVDGAGVVVSIIDTGIDITHQDMRLDDGVETKLNPESGFTAKVPFGYNYADENNTVVDTTSSQHGMHVAGIVAANGGEDASVANNGRINGIAPNAQLLAMKVFSNDPSKGRGAAGDDIIAAIEESVRRGADVINMSLGSANGLVAGESGEQRAIANAVKAGVEVIVAAGNEGLSSSPSGRTDDHLDRLDDGSVGSPSTSAEAISVASVNNSSMVQTVARADLDSSTKELSYQIQAGSHDDEAHTLVYAQLGKPEQIPDAVKGNWALIERGEISFADKVKNATEKGANGVVIYNHASGGDEIPGMAGVDSFNQVVVGIGNTDGQALADALEAGKKVTLTLTDERKLSAVSDALKPSDFTSWGSTSDLAFKPQLAGIGGNVYSTLNDNSYGMMSGTSMASPHVAGVVALLRKQFEQKFPQLSGPLLTERIRVAMANTAKVLTNDDAVPYSARQMGAGLVQTKDALETNVFATVDGSPWVELKDFTSAQSRTVTLRNTSDQDRTFQAGGTCVVNESNGDGAPINTSCSTGDALSVDSTKVTVPANGETQVSFTVTPGSTDKHWVSGWVQFESQDPEQPSLSLPYLGFVGNWNEEPIVDTPIYNENATSYLTEILGEENRTHTQLATLTTVVEETMAPGRNIISPNGDGSRDVIYPSLAMLRNAKTIEVSVLDSEGNTIRKLGSERNVSRYLLSTHIDNLDKSLAHKMDSQQFDGTVWDPQKSEFVQVPDGEYTMRVSSTLAEGRNPQIVDMKFTIDTVPPTIVVDSISDPDENGTITARLKLHDDVALNDRTRIMVVNPAGEQSYDPQPVDEQHELFEVKIANAKDIPYVRAYALDVAGNYDETTVFLGESALSINESELLNNQAINNSTTTPFKLISTEKIITEGKIKLTGTARSDIKSVRFGQTEVPVEADKPFTLYVPVAEGENAITVEAIEANGMVVDTVSFSFRLDNQAPSLTLVSPDTSYPAELNEDGTLTVEGMTSDEQVDVKLAQVNTDVVEVKDGHFKVDVKPADNVSAIPVYVTDGVNITTEIIALARTASATGDLNISANVKPKNQFNFVAPDSPDVTFTDGRYILDFHGDFNRVPSQFMVDGNLVEVSPDGRFSTPIELKQGITSVNVRVLDTDGSVSFDSALKILFDATAPGFDLQEPNIHADGALYRKDTTAVKFAGKVWDNAFGYSLTLNGNVVEDFFDLDDPTPLANMRDFSTSVKIADGDRILLGLYDQAGNAYLQLIPVVVDPLAPKLTIDGVADGNVVPSSQRIKIIAEDPHLDNLEVVLDGKPVKVISTQVLTANGSEIKVKGEPDPGINHASVAANETAVSASTSPALSVDRDSHKESTMSKAELEVLAANDADEKATSVAPTSTENGEGHTILTVELDRPLAYGEHVLSATAVDKAGNRTDRAVVFKVNDAPIIEGPDYLALDVAEDVDQQIRDAYKVVDDQDENLVVTFDSSVLVEGKAVTLRLTATDSMGLTVTRDVQVTLTRAEPGPVPPAPVPGEPAPVPGEPAPVVPGPVDPTDLPSNPADKVTPRPVGPQLPVTGTQAGMLAVIAMAFAAGGLGLVVARRSRERS